MAAAPQEFFSSAVEHYARYRTGYPSRDVATLASMLGLNRTHAVIDIGCGTGQLTIPLARYAGSVTAIDPLPEMLARGRQAARQANSTNITWLLGDSADVGTLISPGVHAATFAASFHWTDRASVLDALDDLIEPAGFIVTINDDLSDAEQPDWDQAVTSLRNDYLGVDHTAATAVYTDAPDTHRDVLSDSSFASIRSVSWEWERQLTIDEAVGLQFSYSFSTPAAFADRAGPFAEDARTVIRELHPSGWVTERFRMEVLIASRPAR